MKHALHIAVLTVTLSLSKGLCRGATNTLWVVEASTNLVSWQAITPTNNGPQAFVRLHVLNAPAATVVSAGSVTIPVPSSVAISNNTLYVTVPASAATLNAIQPTNTVSLTLVPQ